MKEPNMKTTLCLSAILPLMACASAHGAVLVNDNFNDGNFATVGGGGTGSGHVIFNNGAKNITETTVASWSIGGDNWNRSELHSLDEINVYDLLVNQGYSLVQMSWTIQNVQVNRTDGGAESPYRIQLGALPDAVAQGSGAEMWENTAGGVWFDMQINTTGVVSYEIRDANDSKGPGSDGVFRSNGTVAGWDGAGSRTFTLSLDAAGYAWSDSVGNNYGGGTYADAGLDSELLASWWGFIMGQNRANIGNGTHDLTNFTVVAVPEPGSLLLVIGGAIAGLFGRRRSAC